MFKKTRTESRDILEQAVLDALGKKDGSDFAAEELAKYRKKSTDQIANHHAESEQLKTDIDRFLPIADKANSIASVTKNQLKGIAERYRTEIERAKLNHQEALAHFRAFKAQYKIKRLPNDPDELMAFAWLFALGTVEGFGNTAFFAASGSMPNFVEAAKLGFLFSYTNIVLASGIGGFLSFRYLHPSCTHIQRILASIGSALTIASLGIVSYATALVRSTGDFTGLLVAYKSPSVIFDDLYSIMLLSISIAVQVFAAYKGMTSFSETIPGYALVNKQVVESKDDANSASDSGQEELDEVYQEASKGLDKVGENLTDHHNKLVTRVARFNADGKNLKSTCGGYHDNLQKNMQAYAQQSHIIRPELKIVDKTFIPVDVPVFKEIDCKPIKAKLNTAQAKLATIRQELDNSMSEAQKIIDQAIKDFNEIQ